jgi:hypothetical protein
MPVRVSPAHRCAAKLLRPRDSRSGAMIFVEVVVLLELRTLQGQLEGKTILG